MSLRTLGVFALSTLLLAGCAVYYGHRLDERYGRADPARYDHPRPDDGGPSYWRDVKPILDSRCVVCHGCYDAPCQLNLASYQGLTRGMRKDQVYDAGRLVATDPTRLFIDAHSTAQWRSKGFEPVLNERADTAEANREASVLLRSLRLKQTSPAPAGPSLPAERFDFSLDRAQQCSAIETMDAFERAYPDWGMPFGLPALSAQEHAVLARWIETGAPYRPPAPLPQAYLERIAQWERFLNGDSLKQRLMARYIYEHWFVGQLYFDDLPDHEYFELVRSRTPPGRPIERIATRRPYDDPGTERVYYRLRRSDESALAKTRMPLALNAARMARLKAWFLDADYAVAALPSYAPEVASNPFVAFRQLPVTARYRLMLDDARFILTGFIKGPVCRGQVAVNVINDHFWVVFARPDAAHADLDAAFLAQERDNLRLPAEHQSTARLLSWTRYADLEARFLQAKARYLAQRFDLGGPPTLDAIWDGDGANSNAALTVFRHFDSASVVPGLIGERPQTAWVIGYPLLERIHYLLVAGYDVYGNAGHQLATRLYMDFLRMEGELNFLSLLPRDARRALRDHWYRDASEQYIRYLDDTDAYYPGETGIRYRTAQPFDELLGLLRSHLARVSDRRHALESGGLQGSALAGLRELAALRGRAISHLPEASFLSVRDAAGRQHHYTLLKNSAHTNVAEMLREDRRRLPDEDTLAVLSGFAAAYPNAFFALDHADLPAFVAAVRGLQSEQTYQALLTRYGLRRTDARFWPHSDGLHAAYRQWLPREAGLFDYNRFENR